MSSFMDWLAEDSGDRYVQHRLEDELQDAYRSQERQASALRSQVAQVQGTLEQRIDRLAKAFDAFVELSDVRADLAMFQEEGSVRNTALRLLRGLLRSPGEPPTATSDLPRCRGYWLRPAVATILAALSGDTATAARELAEAQELDEVRAAVFLTAAFGLAGSAAHAMPLLPAALQSPGEQATYAQRALWVACAHGTFGEPGEEAIRGWVAGFVRSMGDEIPAAERTRWLTSATQLFTSGTAPGELGAGLPRGLAQMTVLTQPLAAARRLAGLRSWVTEAMTGEPAAAPAAGGPAGGEPADPRAGLAAVAAALAEEGSQEEIALRKRARELREVIDSRKTVSRPSWDAPREKMAELLRGDAFGADLALRRLALSCCASAAAGVAQDLAAAASVAPPEQFQVRVDEHMVQLAATGQASLDAANAEIAQAHEPQGMSDKLFHRKELEAETEHEQQWVATRANAAAAAFAARVTELRAAARQAAADRDAIVALLAQG